MFEKKIVNNVSWNQAMKLEDGWRLPNKWELVLIQCAKEQGHPMFQDMNGWFWTSSAYVGDDQFAWGVNFDSGSVCVSGKQNISNAMLVRNVAIDFPGLVEWLSD